MSWEKENSVPGEKIMLVKSGMRGNKEHSVQRGRLLLMEDTYWDVGLKGKQGPDHGGSCRLCRIYIFILEAVGSP